MTDAVHDTALKDPMEFRSTGMRPSAQSIGGSGRLRSLHAYFCPAQADFPSVFSTVPVTIATLLP
jgi:hypothetical protein